MTKHIIASLLIIATLVSCSTEKEQDPFQISKHNVGFLTDSTQVKDLASVFPNDSIVTSIKGDEFIEDYNDIKVLNKQGKQLLILRPSQALDSTATISTVQIIDSKYKTEKGISVLSTFADINNNYKISKISTLINSVVVSVNEINASFTIDKKELPANLRFNMDINIEAVQIPDNAKIKYLILHW